MLSIYKDTIKLLPLVTLQDLREVLDKIRSYGSATFDGVNQITFEIVAESQWELRGIMDTLFIEIGDFFEGGLEPSWTKVYSATDREVSK